MEHNYLYNSVNETAREEGGYEILHQVDFATHEDAIQSVLEGGDEEGRDEDTKSSKESKGRYHPHKRGKALKVKKRANFKKSKGTIMPSVSSMPSSMPSISNQPTVSAAPSTMPTVSNQPSISRSPSSTPTITSMPSVSAEPTGPPVVASATDVPEPTVLVIRTDPPTPVERITILNKFALRYQLEEDPNPTSADYFALSKVTGWYIGNHSEAFYDDIDQVIFIDADITSYFEPSLLVMDYDSMSYFAQHASFPTIEQQDRVIATSFTSEGDQYVAFLKSNLSPANPFSRTKSIDYATYWEALGSQSNKVTKDEPMESNDSSAKIVAPIVAISGTIILLVGIFVVAREWKRQNDASRVNIGRWDESGANLHMMNKPTVEDDDDDEEDTVILDEPTTPAVHSYIPSQRESGSLSPVVEVDSSDAGDFGEALGRSPSDVMREMNLSSALEDIDLDTVSGGVGELPGRHDRGGIGELPGTNEI